MPQTITATATRIPGYWKITAEYTRRDIAAAAGLSVPRVQELIRSTQVDAGAQPAPEQPAADEHPVPASYGAE